MPRGTDGGVPRIPDDVMLPPLPALAEAQRLLDDEMPFHAHEILEGTWKSCGPEERELWQGLAQLAVGLTHVLRGNRKGALTLLERARRRIDRYRQDPPYGIDVAGLVSWCDDLRERLSAEDLEQPVAVVPTVPQLRSVQDS